MYALTDIVPIGRFSNLAEAKAAVPEEAPVQFIKSPDDLAQHYSEPELRLIRAALKLMQTGTRPSNMRQAAKVLIDGGDSEVSKRHKDKLRAAEVTFKALQAYNFDDGATVDQQPAKPKRVTVNAEPRERKPTSNRPSAKALIRSMFSEVGIEIPVDTVLNQKAIAKSTITTALSDLKNENYCGTDGRLVVERVKHDDKVFYKRTA